MCIYCINHCRLRYEHQNNNQRGIVPFYFLVQSQCYVSPQCWGSCETESWPQKVRGSVYRVWGEKKYLEIFCLWRAGKAVFDRGRQVQPLCIVEVNKAFLDTRGFCCAQKWTLHWWKGFFYLIHQDYQVTLPSLIEIQRHQVVIKVIEASSWSGKRLQTLFPPLGHWELSFSSIKDFWKTSGNYLNYILQLLPWIHG